MYIGSTKGLLFTVQRNYLYYIFIHFTGIYYHIIYLSYYRDYTYIILLVQGLTYHIFVSYPMYRDIYSISSLVPRSFAGHLGCSQPSPHFRSLLTLGSLPSPHVSDGNGSEVEVSEPITGIITSLLHYIIIILSILSYIHFTGIILSLPYITIILINYLYNPCNPFNSTFYLYYIHYITGIINYIISISI